MKKCMRFDMRGASSCFPNSERIQSIRLGTEEDNAHRHALALAERNCKRSYALALAERNCKRSYTQFKISGKHSSEYQATHTSLYHAHAKMQDSM
mmetsp:Transcript_946/g.2038  ORF Transcript_946/g.2038 Transcript_946/m.2038 type:complete len:95 (+) Transcript_946:214-498(+)